VYTSNILTNLRGGQRNNFGGNFGEICSVYNTNKKIKYRGLQVSPKVFATVGDISTFGDMGIWGQK
jgi:hypothetical protein